MNGEGGDDDDGGDEGSARRGTLLLPRSAPPSPAGPHLLRSRYTSIAL